MMKFYDIRVLEKFHLLNFFAKFSQELVGFMIQNSTPKSDERLMIQFIFKKYSVETERILIRFVHESYFGNTFLTDKSYEEW